MVINSQEKSTNQVYLGSIFSQPWWLDAVAPGQWDEIIIEKDGQLVARMPYVLTKRRGLKFISMPALTQTMGPWLAPHQAKYTGQLSWEHQLLTELIESLPSFDYFRQNFHHTVTNCLPFYWQGFQQTTRYTYLIPDLSDLDQVWGEIRSNIRTNIRKAQKQLTIRTDFSVKDFLDLNEMTFQRQGLSLPYSRDLIRRIDQACQTNSSRQIFFAEDMRGDLHAAVYIIWDNQTTYYLTGGSDPKKRNSGATSLLLWEAIKFASTISSTFDFEGSMLQPIERFFRAFGARQTPYFQVTKINALSYKVFRDVKDWGKMLRDQFKR